MKAVYKITSILLLSISGLSFAQTGVTVTYYDGNTQEFNVAPAGKIYFESENLYMKPDGAAVPTTIPVNIIRRITFSNTLATTTFGANKNHLALYPNPGQESIRIKSDINEQLDIKIYSLTGQLILKGSYQSDQEINVSGLSAGLYLVQVNGVTIKFSKK